MGVRGKAFLGKAFPQKYLTNLSVNVIITEKYGGVFMPFDGAFIHSIVSELGGVILSARIEKVLQPEFDEIILMLHTNSGSAKLLLSASASNPRIHLTDVSKKNPAEPPSFCMLLRKHLTGGRIVDIDQPDFDRIVSLTIETKNDLNDITEKKLVIEMMGKYSNIILTDDRDKILDCIRHVNSDMSSVRELFPGLMYEKPPQAGKSNPLLHTEDLPENHTGNESFYSDSYCGISMPTGRELLHMEKKGEINPLPEFIAMTENKKPVTYLNAKGKPDMLPYAYQTIDAEFTEWESPSALLDGFFAMRDKQNRLQQYTANMLRVIKNNIQRCEKKLSLLEKELGDTKDNEKNKLYGELLTANIYMLSKGMDKVTVQNYYDENCADIDVPMRTDLTPSENIQRYYKRYTKGKNTITEVTKQINETRSELEYLQGQLYNAEFADTLEETDEILSELAKEGYIRESSKAKKRKEEKKDSTAPKHFTVESGYDVYVGRNNKQNEYLTHKLSAPDDIWLHAKNIPASHVILKSGGKMPEDGIVQAAVLAAFNSSCRGATRIPVDYCFRKNVHKVSGAKPGFVIYDNYFTVIVDGTEEAVKKILKEGN